jgi:hypothetical protein
LESFFCFNIHNTFSHDSLESLFSFSPATHCRLLTEFFFYSKPTFKCKFQCLKN